LKFLLALLPILASACAADDLKPTAQQKFDEFIDQGNAVESGTEFHDLAVAQGHECVRHRCEQQCTGYDDALDGPSDELLVCRWHEEFAGVSDVVFGSVLSVVYLYDDRIVHRSIELNYTGP